MTPEPWVGMALTMGSFLALLGGLKFYALRAAPPGERLRKLLHTGAGLITLTFPWLFDRAWPVLVLCGLTALLLAGIKFYPPIARRLGQVTSDVERQTLGELYFPVAVALLFLLARGNRVLFSIPVLVLSLADATSALIGERYGVHRYAGSAKSLEGSVAFLVVACLSVHVPLLLATDIGGAETLLIAMTCALLVMLLEGSAWRGLDNLFIPLGGFFLLKMFMPMEAPALALHLSMVALMVVGVLWLGHRTTLDDGALLGGVFITYMAWAVGGWRWVVPPVIVLLAYTRLSPKTAENTKRIHDMHAMLSVTAAGLLWLVGARLLDRPDFFYPYTLTFAGQLALIGIARLAYDYQTKPLSTLILMSVTRAWLLVCGAYVLLEGTSAWTILLATAGAGAVALAALLFATWQPQLRDCPSDMARWLRQTASAAAGSVVGLGLMIGLERLTGR